jgi:hypothetical protein
MPPLAIRLSLLIIITMSSPCNGRSLHHGTIPHLDLDQTSLPLCLVAGFRTTVINGSAFQHVRLAPVGPSARTIIDLNIRHYRELLKVETDSAKRQMIGKLLAEEEAKLLALQRQDTKKS